MSHILFPVTNFTFIFLVKEIKLDTKSGRLCNGFIQSFSSCTCLGFFWKVMLNQGWLDVRKAQCAGDFPNVSASETRHGAERETDSTAKREVGAGLAWSYARPSYLAEDSRACLFFSYLPSLSLHCTVILTFCCHHKYVCIWSWKYVSKAEN